MGKVWTILGALLKTVLIRLPLAVWLGVLFGGAWLAVERHFNHDYPLWPTTTVWPFQVINPRSPENPSQIPQLEQLKAWVAGLPLGISLADLDFGQPAYGAMLGAVVGLIFAVPCSILMTTRRYAGFLLWPVRVVLVTVAELAIFAGLGYLLASSFGTQLINTGYAAALGGALPLLVPLPFLLLFPVFPGSIRRQADTLLRQARRMSKTSLVDIAKHDPALAKINKGKAQTDWEYYATVSGLFLGLLLGEKSGAPAWRKAGVEAQLRRRLKKKYEKGEHGLNAVMQFSKEQLDKGAKFTTEILVGLWLTLQVKGDLNPQRDRDLAAAFGGQLVHGMQGLWPSRGRAGTILGSLLLWGGVGGMIYLAANPQLVQQPFAKAGLNGGQDQDGQAKTTNVAPGEEKKVASELPGYPEAAPAKPVEKPAEKPATEESPAPTEIAKSTGNEPGDKKEPVPEKEPDKSAQPEPKELPVKDPLATEEPPAPTETPAVAEKEPEKTPENKEPVEREWTHSSGRKIQAVVQSYQSGAIELKRTDGRAARVELKDLSQEDRRYLYEKFALPADAQNADSGQMLIREWSDASGTRKVSAALLTISAESVQLLRSDGRLFAMPRSQLSEADQDYLREAAQPDSK